MEQIRFKRMNTEISMIAEQPNTCWQKEMIRWFTDFERICSRFLTTSSLTTFNKTKPNVPLITHPVLYQVIKQAVFWAEKTDFYFNPFLLKEITQLGYDESFEEGWQKQKEVIKHTQVKENPLLFHETIEAIEKKESVELDLGGIGKGFSADYAAELMKRAHIKRGLVDAGGDMRMWSQEKRWTIGIRHPYDKNRTLFHIRLQNGAVATSSKWYRKWKVNQKWQHHLLNGHTGKPSDTPIIQATVVSTHATEADVLAKLLTIINIDTIDSFLNEKKIEIAYAIITKDGTLRMNEAMRNLIVA